MKTIVLGALVWVGPVLVAVYAPLWVTTACIGAFLAWVFTSAHLETKHEAALEEAKQWHLKCLQAATDEAERHTETYRTMWQNERDLVNALRKQFGVES